MILLGMRTDCYRYMGRIYDRCAELKANEPKGEAALCKLPSGDVDAWRMQVSTQLQSLITCDNIACHSYSANEPSQQALYEIRRAWKRGGRVRYRVHWADLCNG